MSIDINRDKKKQIFISGRRRIKFGMQTADVHIFGEEKTIKENFPFFTKHLTI